MDNTDAFVLVVVGVFWAVFLINMTSNSYKNDQARNKMRYACFNSKPKKDACDFKKLYLESKDKEWNELTAQEKIARNRHGG